jgi:hypothetical protein
MKGEGGRWMVLAQNRVHWRALLLTSLKGRPPDTEVSCEYIE